MSAGFRTCSQHGKKMYPTRNAAIGAALRYSRKRGTPLRVYYDKSCGSHHLTKRERLGWREDGAA